jgi:hypothetical protein
MYIQLILWGIKTEKGKITSKKSYESFMNDTVEIPYMNVLSGRYEVDFFGLKLLLVPKEKREHKYFIWNVIFKDFEFNVVDDFFYDDPVEIEFI